MITELLSKVQSLPRADKLRLMQFLVFELAREEGVTLLQPDEEYPIWTPYSAFDAATTLLTSLRRTDPLIQDIRVTDDTITADLTDGRTISVPLVWSWRLSEATPEQRANYEIIGGGEGVHWPDVDEDISAAGMLYGIPARQPRSSRLAPFRAARVVPVPT